MKVYLVIWSECDSGYEIKGAFLSEERAKQRALTLNVDDLQEAVEEQVRWCKKAELEGPMNGRYGPYASLEALRKSLNWFHTELYWHHNVESVEVEG